MRKMLPLLVLFASFGCQPKEKTYIVEIKTEKRDFLNGGSKMETTTDTITRASDSAAYLYGAVNFAIEDRVWKESGTSANSVLFRVLDDKGNDVGARLPDVTKKNINDYIREKYYSDSSEKK